MKKLFQVEEEIGTYFKFNVEAENIDETREALNDLYDRFQDYVNAFKYTGKFTLTPPADENNIVNDIWSHETEEITELNPIPDFTGYNITNYNPKHDTFETIEEIKDKIKCIQQHFGWNKDEIHLDLHNQVDEFDIIHKRTNIHVLSLEVVTREIAISNEADFDHNDPSQHTFLNIGMYSKMVGDNNYYFRQL